MDYARQVLDGKISDSRLFFFHRQAGDKHKLDTRESIREAVIEASGPIAEWSDIEGIVDQWEDPTTDRAYLERVWLNRLVRASEKAFDVELWNSLAIDFEPAEGDLITLGFDGAIATEPNVLTAWWSNRGLQVVPRFAECQRPPLAVAT